MSAFAPLAYRERVPPLRRVVLPTLLAVSAGCAGSLENPERFSDGGSVSDGGTLEKNVPESLLVCGEAIPSGGGLTNGVVNCILEWSRNLVDGGTE